MATIKHHKDLVAWQLAAQLKRRILRIIARQSIARHVRFCDQIRDSSRSGPANIAEGFWRYRPRENARFVRIALGSLGETANHLHDAFTEKYIDEEEYRELEGLAEQALKTTTAWHSYLVSCPDKPPTDRRQQSKQRQGNRWDTKESADSEDCQEPQAKNQKLKTQNRKPKTDFYR